MRWGCLSKERTVLRQLVATPMCLWRASRARAARWRRRPGAVWKDCTSCSRNRNSGRVFACAWQDAAVQLMQPPIGFGRASLRRRARSSQNLPKMSNDLQWLLLRVSRCIYPAITPTNDPDKQSVAKQLLPREASP